MIVHRDARCAVVDKPSGLATNRGWDGADDALLQDRMIQRSGRPPDA